MLAGAGGGRAGPPRLPARLLGADPPTDPAIAAFAALGAPTHATRHCIHVPPELDASFLELLIARRRLVVLLVDAEPLAHRVETRGVLLGDESGNAVGRPLGAHVVRRPEGGRVVDHGAAAQARPGEQADALVMALL